ncbi:MAG: ribosome silencing factor [Dehalococcoidia bacterium]
MSWRAEAGQTTKETNLQGAALARRIVDDLADRQAEEIVLLDISTVSSLADYFVIASATSSRQFEALAEAIKAAPSRAQARREGTADGGWQLFDFGDVVIHLFNRETRAYYRLEELWSAGKQLLRIE